MHKGRPPRTTQISRRPSPFLPSGACRASVPSQLSPCELDIGAAAGSLFQAVIGAVVFVLFLSQVAGSAVDEDALAEQAARSRERRNKSLRAFAKRLRPLQESPLGWNLVDGDGMPTGDAFVFLALAIGAQAWLAYILSQSFFS